MLFESNGPLRTPCCCVPQTEGQATRPWPWFRPADVAPGLSRRSDTLMHEEGKKQVTRPSAVCAVTPGA